MKLRTKILGGYGLVLALLALVCAWAVIHLNRLGRASDAILQENYRSILAAENMVAALERQDSSVLAFMLGNDVDGVAEFRVNEVEFLRWLSEANNNITIEGEPQALAAIETGYLAYLEGFAELRARPDGPARLAYYYETLFPRFQQVRDAATALRDLNQNEMVTASTRAHALSRWAIWSMIVIGLIAGIVGLAFSLILSRRLARPLQAMAQATERIAEGNYDVSVPVESKDEMGQLAQKIMLMSRKLKEFHELNVGQVIAEKQRSEAIIRSITDGLIVVDADYNIIAMNPRARQIFTTTPEQARHLHLFEVVKNEKLYEHVKATTEHGKPLPDSDEDAMLVVGRNGQRQYYHYAVTPVTTEQGQMLGVVILLQDVTKLKELDQLKSDFVMTASHELRTPLTSMAMSIGLLIESARSKLSPREYELLQAAQEDAQRLRALVNDLLDLSRIEAGRITMEMEPVAVSLLVDRALTPFKNQAAEKEVELAAAIPDDISPVLADPNKITWVLTNLIANALRYTDSGGHITLSAENRGNHVYVSVADDGMGIPMAYQSKIFDKFVQVKNNKTAGGTGLGLAISKEIVKAHGGTIWVKSTPGAGSTFTFTLPVAIETETAATNRHHEAHEGHEGVTYGKREDSRRR